MLRADPINSAHLAPVQPLKISLAQSSQCSGAAQPPHSFVYISPPPSSLTPSLLLLSNLCKTSIFYFHLFCSCRSHSLGEEQEMPVEVISHFGWGLSILRRKLLTLCYIHKQRERETKGDHNISLIFCCESNCLGTENDATAPPL